MDKVTVKYKGRRNLGCRKGLADGSLATSNMRPSTDCDDDCDIPKDPTHVDSNCILMHKCNDCGHMFYAITSPAPAHVQEVFDVIEENEKLIKPAILPQLKKSG